MPEADAAPDPAPDNSECATPDQATSGEAAKHQPDLPHRQNDEHTTRALDWRFALVFATLTAVALLASARALLNPLILALILIYLISPYRAAPWARRLIVTAISIGVLWLVVRLGGALAPFVIALVVAYFLDPAVDRLEARGMGRSLAIFVLMVPVFAVIVGALLLILPPLTRELGNFVRQIPQAVNVALGYLELIPEEIVSTAELEVMVRSNLPNLLEPLNAVAAKVGSGAIGGVGWGVRFVSFVVITPLATFYALRDIDRLKAAIASHFPERSPALSTLSEIDRLLGRYLRGQLIVCSVLGVLTIIGLTLLGVPYALLLGLFTGIMNIVPIIGFWVSFVPVLLVGLTMTPPLLSVIKIAIFYLVVQTVESSAISPRIVGDEVGLNPVLMILSITVFSSLLGAVGVLIAVPVAAVLALLYSRWRQQPDAQSNR